MANVAKYARASIVHVSVTHTDELATVTVDDDGVGGADPTHGTGLRGLADRVETLGGSFAVRSIPGEGTRLTAEIPLTSIPPEPTRQASRDLLPGLGEADERVALVHGWDGCQIEVALASREMVTVESVL